MWTYSVALLALLIATQSVHGLDLEAEQQFLLSKFVSLLKTNKISPSINIGCVIEYCTKQSAGCLLNGNCRSAISCSQSCFNEWDNDTTPDKFHVQNCTNKCSFTYGNGPAFENFMSCLTSKQCISFPPIPNTCRGSSVKVQKQLSLNDVQGAWWVVKGFHPVYDCYPCQQLFFNPINVTVWSYNPKYEVYLVNGSLTSVTQHFVLPNTTAGSNITFTYFDVGLDHRETWWLLDKAPDGSYVLLYYCGNTLQWYYEGALVFSRTRTLSDTAYTNIAASYQKAIGLDLKQFCNPDTSSRCPN